MKQIFSYQLSRFGGHAHFIGNSICFILLWNLVLIWMLPTQFALELRCIQRISLCFISFVDCLSNTLKEGDLLVVITSKAVCMLYQIGSFKTIKLYLTHMCSLILLFGPRANMKHTCILVLKSMNFSVDDTWIILVTLYV